MRAFARARARALRQAAAPAGAHALAGHGFPGPPPRRRAAVPARVRGAIEEAGCRRPGRSGGESVADLRRGQVAPPRIAGCFGRAALAPPRLGGAPLPVLVT